MLSFLVWAATAVSCGLSFFMDGVVDTVAIVAAAVTLVVSLLFSKGKFWKNLLIDILSVALAYVLGIYVLKVGGYLECAPLFGLISSVIFLMRPHLKK